MKISILIFFTIIYLNTNFIEANEEQQIIYKDCLFFQFQNNSKECQFIEKLNTDLKKLDLKSKEFYITRLINDSTKEIESYDIVGNEEIEFLQINYSKELEDYFIYLDKVIPQVVILDFYD